MHTTVYLLSLLSVFCVLLAGCASTNALPVKPNSPKVALVLGGGGAKGFAHIGVIRALEQHQIIPDLIVGTSSGAMVGAIYASGKTGNELAQIALDIKHQDLLEFTPSKQGLLDGNKLRQFINQQVKHRPIEALPIAFVTVATEVKSGQAVAFASGETGLAVQASAAVPKLFIAPRIPEPHGNKYSDGGQSALLPARIGRTLGADIVISVDVLSTPKTSSATPTNPLMIFDGDFWQLLEQFTPQTAANPLDIGASDIVIRPHLPYSVFDGSERFAMIQAGFNATLPYISQIHTLIRQHQTNQLNTDTQNPTVYF